MLQFSLTRYIVDFGVLIPPLFFELPNSNFAYVTNSDIYGFNNMNDFSSEHPSWEGKDHLPYLQEKPSIFEDEVDDKVRKRILVCAGCDHPVTAVSEKINIRGRHDHGFRYFNETVQLGCFRKAQGCIGVQRISNGYSWFQGYAWQIQVCGNCHTQLGWKYMSEDDNFYGLIFKMLREVDSGDSE